MRPQACRRTSLQPALGGSRSMRGAAPTYRQERAARVQARLRAAQAPANIGVEDACDRAAPAITARRQRLVRTVCLPWSRKDAGVLTRSRALRRRCGADWCRPSGCRHRIAGSVGRCWSRSNASGRRFPSARTPPREPSRTAVARARRGPTLDPGPDRRVLPGVCGACGDASVAIEQPIGRVGEAPLAC